MNDKIKNKLNQRAFKKRQKELGFVQVTVWIKKTHKNTLKKFVKNLTEGNK